MFDESVLSENVVIDDKLLKCFAPVYAMQKIVASVRVNIRNNVITHTTIWQTVYSICCIILFTFSCLMYYDFYYKAFFKQNVLLYFALLIGNLTQHLSYILNIFINRFTERENNIKIYLMLQNIDRMLQLDDGYYTHFQGRINKIITVLIVTSFCSGSAANAISLLIDHPEYLAFFVVGPISSFMDILLEAAMIYYLVIRARVVNGIIKKHIREYQGIVKKKSVITLRKRLLSLVIPVVRESYLHLERDKWLECIREMLKTYKTINKLFNFTMLNLSIIVLLWSFIIIGTVVLGLRNGLYPFFGTITLATWASVYYVNLTVIAVFSDWFIMEIKKTKLLCIRLTACDYDGPFQKVASNIIEAIHYDTPKFVVYDIYVYDRGLPLDIVAIIAANVMVLVQFITE